MKSMTSEATDRRISEAKTTQEKALLLQQYADQLRLEKLRAKRMRENLNGPNTQSNSIPPAMQTTSAQYTASFTGQTKFSIPGQTSGAFGPSFCNQNPQPSVIQQRNVPANEVPNSLNAYAATNFERFKNAAGKVNTPPDHANEAASKLTYEGTMAPRRTDTGMSVSDFMRRLSTTSTPAVPSAPAQPLNVYAQPFMMQPKRSISDIKPPILQPQTSLPATTAVNPQVANFGRQISLSPPMHTPNKSPIMAAVAPKMAPKDFYQPLQSHLDGRQRSASIGSQLKTNVDHPRQQVDFGDLMKDQAEVDEVGRPRSNSRASLHETDDYQYGNKSNGFSPFQHAAVEAQKASRPMGNVRIASDTVTGSGSLLGTEDWDSDYGTDRARKVNQERTPSRVASGFGKRHSAPTYQQEKDWLTVLKERDDIANRRYSRETMLHLTQCEASKIRPAHLNPEYNNSVGIWSPDLWFHVTFQNEPPSKPLVRRNQISFQQGGRGAISVDSAERTKDHLRPINSLADYQREKDEQQGQRASAD